MQTQTHDVTFSGTEVRKRFRSWDHGEAEQEWACLTLLAEHAPGVAPRPLRRETEDGAPVVVMERLPGEPLGSEPLTGAQTRSLGRALRRLYDVPLPALRASGLRERRYGPSTHRETVASWLGDTHDLAACKDPALVAHAVEAALAWLASSRLPDPQLAAVGIADLNPANVLWDGSTCRLVDFEDGGLTDPAYELADHTEHIAGRLGRPGRTGPDRRIVDPEALVDAVGITPVQWDRMRSYRPLWAAFWLAVLLPGNGGFGRNPPGTTEAQARHLLTLLEECAGQVR